MRVLVTGGCGFIGSHVVEKLLEKGHEPIVVHRPTCNSENLKHLKVKEYSCDIRNIARFEYMIKKVDAIIHMAALINVDQSIQDPWIFWDINVKGTAKILDMVRKHKKRLIYMGCHDEKTRAFTNSGLKRFDEIKLTDKVLSLNPKTKLIEWKSINKIISNYYEGEMVGFKGKRINLNVTPNHRMLIENTANELLFEEAKKSANRSCFFLPTGKWQGFESTNLDIDAKIEDLLYLLGIYIGDGYSNHQIKHVKNKSGLSREEFLKKNRDDKGRFVVKHSNNSKEIAECNSFRIWLALPEGGKDRSKSIKILTDMKINSHPHKDYIFFSSKKLYSLLRTCGSGAHSKCIPKWVLSLTPNLLKHLFDGLMDSDGYKDYYYTTVSKQLLNDIIELVHKMGRNVSFRLQEDHSIIKGRKVHGTAYRICISKTPRRMLKKNVVREFYKGIIWCLEVPDNQNFLVEREGKCAFSGNSCEVYGNIQNGKATEEHPTDPRSPYAASKFSAERYCLAYHYTYNIPLVVIRGFNIFGPRQSASAKGAVIPKFVMQVLNNQPPKIFGDGSQTRDFIYVTDIAEGIVMAAEKEDINGEIIHLATGKDHQIKDVANKIIELSGKNVTPEFITARPGEMMRSIGDYSKAKRLLGWEPKVDFEDGLKKTIGWFKQNEQGR